MVKNHMYDREEEETYKLAICDRVSASKGVPCEIQGELNIHPSPRLPKFLSTKFGPRFKFSPCK